MTEPVGATKREAMVARLRSDGMADERVLAAMGAVPRERFVGVEDTALAYAEQPLPIGADQTISAPDMVAMMAAALGLTGTENVLEVGGGTGYAAAVLSRCARRVVTIEWHASLAERARELMVELGYDNVEVRGGDGSRGAPDQAPFDAISVAAMADDIPTALVDQLTPDGTLVCPVGVGGIGDLVRLHRGRRERLSPAGFVPLITS